MLEGDGHAGAGETRRPPAGTLKAFDSGTDRTVAPQETLRRVRPLLRALGITRVADVTGLDRVGLPVVAVTRPNSRSVSVSMGKGPTPEAAEVSGIMEALEGHHAERVTLPLVLASHREIVTRGPTADVTGLPRLSIGTFHEDLPLLWMEGVNLLGGVRTRVPFEVVHTDFRVPLPTGSGAFFMSSNGLASGNHALEAVQHALCELVERDANTLWHLGGGAAHERIDPGSIGDPLCREALDRFENANLAVHIWETTSDVGISSFLCTLVDRDAHEARPMPPISGSGCHPRRPIALLRALTEAAQGRLTFISGARDDLAAKGYDARHAGEASARLRGEPARGGRSFAEGPDAAHPTFEDDVRWILARLAATGFEQAIAIHLTLPEFGVPVVRAVVPHLESMSEVPGYVPGGRARLAMARAPR
jgi:ribosomal protein S12 methylthiotransferase accessory factor